MNLEQLQQHYCNANLLANQANYAEATALIHEMLRYYPQHPKILG